jgi:hypothetical protein
MTTSTFTSPIDSDTDADFRAWGSQISAQLAAIGLTQTADTGQINWSTVSIAGYPGAVGYEIWAFNDAAQSTTPIVMKIEYGASGAEMPQMWLTVGATSDGAGAINSTLKTSRSIIMGISTSFGLASPSFLCYKAASGFLGVALKVGVEPPFGAGFIITRTNDTAGVVTTDGFNVMFSGSPGSNMNVYFQGPGHTPNQLPPTGIPAVGALATWPLALTSSAADGSVQAMPMFAFSPAVQVNAQICLVIQTEIPPGNQFTLNIVGSTPRNLISIGGLGTVDSSTYGIAMVWE